ncbi:type VII secretion integral membrane protein EccD [Micromonospora sp. WMMD1082]|uniref:type VII secretion integral membrane protein EccD n=1 Tax=Micromonospora sp. WMMD1082 TaxID=3016104 RepID=UPI00241719AC|nr:type VII secretion integral membrane protein EccD [Micromonospora sp. WMMD1082]MDG4795728.1 type VII secretion integral membrane protein EccD [Micromonospora sp. WMMD1082]
MAGEVTGDMCRLVVCGPDRRVDVAVPEQVVIADLLPVLLRQLGDNLADAGLDHGGWVLQRLGSPALDENGSVSSLGLRDGDVVHLRPRAEQIPPAAFDDMIDGVAAGLAARSGRWKPEMTRWAALGGLALALVVGVIALGLPASPAGRATAAGLTALLLAAASAAVGRAVGDRPVAILFGGGALGYAALAGLSLPDLTLAAASLRLGGPHVFTAAVAVGAAGLAAGLAIGAARLAVVTVATAVGVAAAGAAAVAFLGAPATATAGAVAVVGTVAATLVPVTAFRMARMRLKPLPTEPEHLQEDIDPEPSGPLLAGAAVADRCMTALYAGLAVPTTVALVLLGFAPRWDTLTLILLVALVRLLSLRPMTSAWHRLAQGAPAVLGLCAAAIGALTLAPLAWRPYAAVAVLLLAGLLAIAARLLPGRRLMPYWGRIGDLAQTVATVATIPVLLATFGVYQHVRAMGG